MSALVIDNFAGGGGASTGIEAALGRPVDVAINHDPEAIAMHKANHPGTRHFCQSIMSVDPLDACTVDGKVRRSLLWWFSPDCKHFSKAKGGKPVEKRIRDLAWVVVHWAERLGDLAADVIMIENVEEFRTWGPLVDGRPCPERKGEEFDLWVRRLRRCGYKVEWRELVACDYGAPTKRKRLFLIARRDGKPIVWPEPTHGEGRLQPWRTAAEIIDWSIPCPSIFERTRPLKDATCRRIARGIVRYVLKAAWPFIVPVTNGGWNPDRTISIDEPLPTITTAKGGKMALAAPCFARTAHGEQDARGKKRGRGDHGPDEPFPTVTASQDSALIGATLIQTGYGEREGQAPRVPGLDKPLGTVVAGGAKHALVTAFMAQHNAGNGCAPRAMTDPVSTITGRGTQQQLCTSHLVKLRGTCRAACPERPPQADGRRGQPVDEPLHTISAGGLHFGEVRAFLIKYYGNEIDGHGLGKPVTTKDRFGLVTVTIDGEVYALADIGMRMLSARELYAAQGFPSDYIIDCAGPNGKPLTKTAQVRMCGNSVSPVMPEALIRANLPEHCAGAERAAA